MAILDHRSRPIQTGKLAEPQTASIAMLRNQWHDVNTAAGLSPARLASLFEQAAQGNLADQAVLFESMLERDAHMYAEMDKRKSAPGTLDWSVAPPRNASAAEKKLAAYAEEVLRDLPDFEDIVKALMDGVGHGFSALEITWQKAGGELLPAFEHRPQEWFQLNYERTALTLRDGSMNGADLQPFGWVMHTHGLAKTGYLGKMPLYRVLAWPFLYKLYGIGDFAEFLEIYGLPIIMGKYPSGANTDQQDSLKRAVMALAHDARAIMPADMAIEIESVSSGAASTGHLDFVAWADKAQSKCILGGTLTSQADGKTSTNALGNVHNDVRDDIRNADCRQIAGTITRDIIYPFLALNKGGIDSLRRCPRLVFDTGEAEDLALFADSLPKLAAVGMKIPSGWAHDKLKIPQPEGGEPVLGAPESPPAMNTTTANGSAQDSNGSTRTGEPPDSQAAEPGNTAAPGDKPARAAASIGARASSPAINAPLGVERAGGDARAPSFTLKQQAVEDLGDPLLAALGSPIDDKLIHAAIKAATGPEDLEQRLAALMAGADMTAFVGILERALFAADVLGYVHAAE
jgi:phage gp29-like protein